MAVAAKTSFLIAVFISALFAFAGARTDASLNFPMHAATRTLLNIQAVEEVKAQCKSQAKATVFLVSDGKVEVNAKSSCKAFATSISNVANIVEEFIRQVEHVPAEGCTTVKVEKVIEACAQAIAKVYTEASVEINIKGKGAACASASAQGDAYAKAYAALMVNLWLGITTGKTTAESEAQIGALNYALSSVWAEAKVKRCLIGSGSIEDFEKSLAEQVRVALTCVTAELSVKICDVAFAGQATVKTDCSVCDSGELKALLVETESEADVGVCSKTFSLVNKVEGTASTTSEEELKILEGKLEPTICAGKYLQCCDSFYKQIDDEECLCGKGCTMKFKKEKELWFNLSTSKFCTCKNLFSVLAEKKDK